MSLILNIVGVVAIFYFLKYFYNLRASCFYLMMQEYIIVKHCL